MSTKPIRVLHVDDNPDARALLSYILKAEADLEDVGARSDAEGLEQAVREAAADVLLIDLTMSGPDPIEAIGQVHAAFPGLRIVVLSGSRDPVLLERAKKAGASQIALKAIGFTETLAAIRGGTR